MLTALSWFMSPCLGPWLWFRVAPQVVWEPATELVAQLFRLATVACSVLKP
jgi:hypothetical protein